MGALARFTLAMLLAACGQALLFTLPVPGPAAARVTLFVLRLLLIFLAAWAASLPRTTPGWPLAAGAMVGTVLVWAVVVVQRNAQEVGTFGAIVGGLLLGAAFAVPGVAMFLLLRWAFRSGGLWRRRKGYPG